MSLIQVTKPALQFPFNGSNVDSVTNLSPLSSVGANTFEAGKYNQAIRFNNTGTTVSSNLAYNTQTFTFSQGITLTAWIKYNSFLATQNQAIDFYGTGGFFGIWVNNTTNKLIFFTGTAQLDTGISIVLGQWIHVAVWTNGTNMTMYVQGVATSATQATTGSNTCNKLAIASSDLGRDPAAVSVQDLRIYNTALSDIQVQSLYANGGAPGVPASLTMTRLQGQNTVMTGTPILSQLSVAPVAAFSLRAVGGTTARAVQVVPAAAFPPSPFTSAATQSVNQYTQSLSGYPFGGSGTYVANTSTVFSASLVGWKAFSQLYNTSGVWASVAGGYSTLSPFTYTGSVSTTDSSANSYGGEWIQLQTPNSIILVGYTISNGADSGAVSGQSPTKWWVLGSTTGVNGSWVLIDAQTGITWSGALCQTKTFTTSQTSSYTYFRVVINQVNNFNVGVVQLSGVSFVGSVPSLAQDFYADRLGNLLTAPVTGQSLSDWLGGSTGYVATWYDQSGNGNHATQGTQANRPVIQKGTKGPGYSVLFNGTTNNLILGSGSFLSNTPYSVSTVERRNTASFPMLFFGRVGGASITGSLHIGYVTNTALRFGLFFGPSTDEAISAYAGSAEPVGYNIQTFSTTSFMRNYRNAVLGSNNASTTPITNTDGTYSIGLVSTNYYSGEMYEILVFTKSLYDLDGTSSITQIYNNQLSYTGT